MRPATLLKIGARNLLRNRRRSIYTLFSIAVGVAAVNVFGGFHAYIDRALRASYIFAQAHGHLTVFRSGYMESGLGDPAGYLLDADALRRIDSLARADDAGAITSPRLHLTGLLSSGEQSLIFMGMGVDPDDLDLIRGRAPGFTGRLRLYDGEPLSSEIPYGIGVGTGLAERLGLGPRAPVIAVGSTVHGQMNALDAEMLHTFDPAIEILRDKVLLLPLPFAQSLYDTLAADRVAVLLEDGVDVDTARARLQSTLDEAGLDLEVATWEELSPLYTRVRQMFDVIFLFVFVIVFVIAFTSVVNTVSMSVLERTREVGTLRSLGVKRRGVVQLFWVESGLLGVGGAGVGVILTLATWLAIRILEPQWTPPIFAYQIPLEIEIVPGYLLSSILALVALSMLAATVPAQRAAARNIVDALAHT